MLLGDPRQSDQRTQSSTSPSSFINHSTLLLNRALKRQAPILFTCTSKFERSTIDRLRTRRRVGSARHRGNHMHDHSRFQRDINDVTGVSLSLSLSLSPLSQKSLTHNIGSASALPIIMYVQTLFYKQKEIYSMIPPFLHTLISLRLVLPWTKKKRTMLLMHKIRILWYRGIMELDSTADPRANATCDCRDWEVHAAKSDRRFFDITWCITTMVLFLAGKVEWVWQSSPNFRAFRSLATKQRGLKKYLIAPDQLFSRTYLIIHSRQLSVCTCQRVSLYSSER